MYACQILGYEFTYAPKAHSRQKPFVMNLYETKLKLRSFFVLKLNVKNIKAYGKGKSKVLSVTCHEGPEGE